MVVIFPVEQQLRIGDRKVQDKLVQFAAANGIEVLDLYPALERRWREGLYVDFWNQAKMADKLHLNEHGHEVVAHEIGAYLIEKKAQFFRKVSSGRNQ
jgi:lysophospholipase L1-like esterase